MKILVSKFYLCQHREVHPELGAFDTETKAMSEMYFVKERTDTELRMERKLEYRGYRAVSGRMILKARVPYTIAQPNTGLQATGAISGLFDAEDLAPAPEA